MIKMTNSLNNWQPIFLIIYTIKSRNMLTINFSGEKKRLKIIRCIVLIPCSESIDSWSVLWE